MRSVDTEQIPSHCTLHVILVTKSHRHLNSLSDHTQFLRITNKMVLVLKLVLKCYNIVMFEYYNQSIIIVYQTVCLQYTYSIILQQISNSSRSSTVHYISEHTMRMDQLETHHTLPIRITTSLHSRASLLQSTISTSPVQLIILCEYRAHRAAPLTGDHTNTLTHPLHTLLWSCTIIHSSSAAQSVIQAL